MNDLRVIFGGVRGLGLDTVGQGGEGWAGLGKLEHAECGMGWVWGMGKMGNMGLLACDVVDCRCGQHGAPIGGTVRLIRYGAAKCGMERVRNVWVGKVGRLRPKVVAVDAGAEHRERGSGEVLGPNIHNQSPVNLTHVNIHDHLLP
eukprot:609361-Amorphochlora_amoeboformis.AAC.1